MKQNDVAFTWAFGPNKLCVVDNDKYSDLGLQLSASLSGSNSQHHSIHLLPEWKQMQPPPYVFTTFKWTRDQSSCESLRMRDAASGAFIRFYKLIQLKQPTQEPIRQGPTVSKHRWVIPHKQNKRQNEAFYVYANLTAFLLWLPFFVFPVTWCDSRLNRFFPEEAGVPLASPALILHNSFISSTLCCNYVVLLYIMFLPLFYSATCCVPKSQMFIATFFLFLLIQSCTLKVRAYKVSLRWMQMKVVCLNVPLNCFPLTGKKPLPGWICHKMSCFGLANISLCTPKLCYNQIGHRLNVKMLQIINHDSQPIWVSF